MIKLKEDEFQAITTYVHSNYGVDLRKKRHLIEGRLSHYVSQLGYDNYMDYFEYVKNDKKNDEISVLINKLTTNHTYFLRESEHFDFYKQQVLPWVDETTKTKDLRVWSAGCSSGQEPYTLAMIMADFFGTDAHHWDKKLLATDISNQVLDIARRGIYDKDRIQVLPPNWKLRYFKNYDASQMMVVDEIKKEVIFRRFNLMTPTFVFKKKFDVVFCRNVMIYFDQATKDRLVEKIYNYTEPGGYLFIGHAESLNLKQTNYKFIMPAVYQKPF